MKLNVVFLGLFLFVAGCNTSPREKNASKETREDEIAVSENSQESNPSGIIWKYSFNQQLESFEIKQMRPVDSDTLTGRALEKIISNEWPGIEIKFTGTSNDTAYLSIPHSEVLTQQMGSAGARSFMISTTWSFTELKGIEYVSFDFEYGDHAMPGVYSRNSWKINE